MLLAFARLSYDNEITAMKSAGISFYQMMPPVAIVASCAWLVTLTLTLFVLPGGNSSFKRVLVEMAQSRAQLGLKERVFNNQFDGLVFFINRISPDGRRLHQVFISDERSPQTKNTIVAEEGMLLTDPTGKRILLRLLRGNILRVGEKRRSAQTIYFDSYDFNVDLHSVAFDGKSIKRNARYLSSAELKIALAESRPGSPDHYKFLLEWHQRLSLPFACLVLGFIAAPLSVQSGTRSRLSGVVYGLFIFLLYYVLVSAAKALGEDGTYPPAIGMWLPNVIFGVLAVVLWIKTARESPFKPIAIVRQFVDRLHSWIKDRLHSNS